MYSKQRDKFSFQQQYPFYTTCNPTALKFSARMLSDNSSPVSRRTSSTVIPITSLNDEEPNNDIPENRSHKMPRSTSSSSSSSYWSWTFGITVFPFFFWGCPSHLFLTQRPPIRTTRRWLKCIFDCSNNHPFSIVLTCVLLIFSVLVNMYFLYLFAALFNSLFIAGVYETSVFSDLIDFLRDIPLVIPINFVWLFGFKINNIVSLLNQKQRMYTQIACGGYRVRLTLMLIMTACVHVIRYFSYKKYSFSSDLTVFQIWHTIWDFSVDIFVTLTFPVYCSFCYAVRYELSIIKTLVYQMISTREIPNIHHLSKFKMLYTHAADHIRAINNFFSIYLSLTIVLTIIGTIVDAENLVGSITSIVLSMFGSIFGGSSVGSVVTTFGEMMNSTMWNSYLPDPARMPNQSGDLNQLRTPDVNTQTTTEEDSFSPVTVRQVNADVTCIVLVYALVFFTIWQAVVTNDWAREVHVWLNDFVSGAGGTDVKGTLMELGVVAEDDDSMNKLSSGLGNSDEYGGESEALIWARNTTKADDDHYGHTDQFLEKFRMLKSYIRVRMQLENPALLTVALVGVFLPSLSGRLKRYNVRF